MQQIVTASLYHKKINYLPNINSIFLIFTHYGRGIRTLDPSHFLACFPFVYLFRLT